MKEDGNKCVLHLLNFQINDVGEYEVIFPEDEDDNEIFQMKEASGIPALLIVFLVVLAAVAVLLLIVWIKGQLGKYSPKSRKIIEDG